MKKIVSVMLAIAMALCCAVAEDTLEVTAEVTIDSVSYEYQYAELDETYGLVAAVPAEWMALEVTDEDKAEGIMFSYGDLSMALTTQLVPADLDTIYALYAEDEECTGFVMATINGNTWLMFSTTDDLTNIACLALPDGNTLCIEFDSAEPMGENMLPVEILSSVTTKDAVADAQ